MDASEPVSTEATPRYHLAHFLSPKQIGELMFPWGEKESRAEPRHEVPQSAEFTVGVARQGSDWTIGELIDLSQSGAKLYLDTVLQFSESVIFGLVLPSLDIEMAMNSTIVWSRAISDDKWMIGCSFEKPIPSAVLDELAGAGLIERRRYSRISVCVPGMARSQLSTEFEPVTVTDYSVGGFRIESSASHDLNQCVCVQFSPDATVFGVVKWKSTKGQKYEYGCEFIRDFLEHSYAKVIERFCSVPTTPLGSA